MTEQQRERARERSRISEAKRAREARAAGLCVVCKKRPARDEKTMCKECAEIQSRYNKKQWQKKKEIIAAWRAAGLCTLCGGTPSPGRKRCEACRKKDRRYYYQDAGEYLKDEMSHPETKTNADLDHIEQEAREQGLSYGKLVAMRYMEGMR